MTVNEFEQIKDRLEIAKSLQFISGENSVSKFYVHDVERLVTEVEYLQIQSIKDRQENQRLHTELEKVKAERLLDGLTWGKNESD